MNAHPLMLKTQITIARMLARKCAAALFGKESNASQMPQSEEEIRALAEVMNAQGIQPVISREITRALSEEDCRALVRYLEHDRSGEVRLACERLALIIP